MFNANTVAKAKVVKSKFKNKFRVIVAFNVTQKNEEGKLLFPPQKKCAYVSGDLFETDVLRTLMQAQNILRTSNIELVG